MSIDNIRRIQGDNIAQGAKHIGDVVLYDVKHACVPRTELRRIFDAHGFGAACPESIDPSTALGRARARQLPADMKIETIANKRADTTAAFMLYQITRAANESGDGFTAGARVRVENGQAVVLPPEDRSMIEICYTVGSEIAKVANTLVTHADGRDITGSAIKVLEAHLGAHVMRPKGGVYFLLPDEGRRWQAFANDLAPYGFVDLSYPLGGDVRAMRTAQHVVKNGLEDEIARLQDELIKVGDTTRKSTIEARANECEALIGRAAAFAEILGTVRDDLVARAQQARAEFLAKLGGGPALAPPASGPQSTSTDDDDWDW